MIDSHFDLIFRAPVRDDPTRGLVVARADGRDLVLQIATHTCLAAVVLPPEAGVALALALLASLPMGDEAMRSAGDAA